MRKTGPILILVIGLLALLVDFYPRLRLPDLGGGDPDRRNETRPRPRGRAEGRVPGSTGRRAVARCGRHERHPRHHRTPRERVGRVRARRDHPGNGPRRGRAARRVGSRIRAAAGRQDRAPGLRADPDRGDATRREHLDQLPATVQRRASVKRDAGSGSDRREDRRLRAEGPGRQAVRRLHGPARRRLLRHHPGPGRHLRTGHQELDPQRTGANLVRRGRWLRPQGSDRPRHDPQVRIAAIPCDGAGEREHQRHAWPEFLHQTLLAGAIGIAAGARLHARLLPPARRGRRACPDLYSLVVWPSSGSSR